MHATRKHGAYRAYRCAQPPFQDEECSPVSMLIAISLKVLFLTGCISRSITLLRQSLC
jgi:hypothetical protein